MAERPSAVPYTERFRDASWEWMQDEELRQLTMTPQFTREVQLAWFDSLASKPDYHIWGIEISGEPVGAFGIKNIADGRAEYWGYVGQKGLWGTGIGGAIIDAALEKALDLGLHSLYLKVIESNSRAIRLYLRHGFREYRREGDVLWMERTIA